MNELSHCSAVLALELGEGSRPQRATLDTEQAGVLAGCIAGDLGRLLPGVDQLGVCLVAALYDQAQLLRQGFPLFSELNRLFRGSQQNAVFQPTVLALGSHLGEVPSRLLQPEAELHGSSLLLLPLVLLGRGAQVQAISEQMESQFVERGMADAATAWQLQQLFGADIAHARYMSVNDLAALSAIQLDHVDLSSLWSLIELSLWPRRCTHQVLSPSGQPWAWRNGGVEYPALGYRAIQAALNLDRDTEPALRQQRWIEWLLQQRQFQLTLAAHRVPCVPLAANDLDQWLHAPSLDQGFLLEWLAEPPQEGEHRDACLHEHPQLGSVAISLGVLRHGHWETVAHGYPLQADCGPRLFQQLGLSSAPRALGYIATDDAGSDLRYLADDGFQQH